MSERRRDAATATVGLGGLAGAGALRHEALVRSYNERRPDPWATGRPGQPKSAGAHKPIKRPPMLGELRMIKHPKGRKVWLAGAGLGAVSLPAAATGVHGVLSPRKVTASKRSGEERAFWREGVAGAKDAVVERTRSVTERPPPKLVAGNYAAGAGVGAATGGLTHLALRRSRIGGHGKAALAAAGGAVAGTAALPLQSRATERITRGRYVVTPTGVRAKKTKPKRASSAASIYDARSMPPAAFRDATVGKRLPLAQKCKYGDEPATKRIIHAEGRAYIPVCDRHLEHGKAQASRVTPGGRPDLSNIDRVDDIAKARKIPRPPTTIKPGARFGPLTPDQVADIRAGRQASAKSYLKRVEKARRWKGAKPFQPTDTGLFTGAEADKVGMEAARVKAARKRARAAQMRRQAMDDVGKATRREDLGANMSRGERRARVTAAGVPLPIVGDVMQGAAAARYAAPGNRGRAAATNFAGGQTGQLVGAGLGAAGALAAARYSPGFNRGAQSASDKVDSVTTAARAKVGLKPTGRSRASRVLDSPRTPKPVSGAARRLIASPAGRAVARNPKVAAIGALAGGQIGGLTGQQTAYGRVMTRDDKLRAMRKNDAGVAYRIHKATATTVPLSAREREKLARRKRQSAAMSVFGGLTGIGALGATAGEAALSPKGPLRGRNPVLRGRLRAVQVPLITSGAGVGGINAFTGAKVQRTEAKQIKQVKKALTVPGVRLRAPAMRRGYLRQVRYPSGQIKVSTVRGGLS